MTNLKRFFGLAAALVLALTVGGDAAWAQLREDCYIQNSFTRVRSEGITEMIGDIQIDCDPGAIPAATGARMMVEFMGGVQITNTVDSSSNKVAQDIVLLFNNGAAADGSIGDPYAETDNYRDRLTSGTDDNIRTVNGKLTDSSTVEFFYDRPAKNPTTDFAIFRIQGIRVNASAADGDIMAQVTTTDRALWLPRSRGEITVARTSSGLASKRVGDPISGLVCTASAKANAAAVRDNTDANIAKLEVKEGFSGAFKADELPGVGGDSFDGQGTRIMLSFADVPDGVNVYLRPGDEDNNGTMDETNGLRCDEDNGGDAGGMLALQLLTSRGSNTGATADDNDYVKVDLSGGAGAAVYRVTAADDTRTENCDIPIFYQRAAGAADEGTGTVSASFAPMSTSYEALSSADQVPRFQMGSGGSAMNMITISECSTTLLFPFVTNQAGFDTGISIANTSMDPMGTSENGGTCDIHYFGTMPEDGAAPDMATSSMIEGGEHLVFAISGGNAAMEVPGAAGFQGYLMAQCHFQFAHGVAFITNGYGEGDTTVAHGYLALVVPMMRASAGDVESLGN